MDDVARFMRLVGAIRGALEAHPPSDAQAAAVAAEPIARAYRTLRHEAEAAIHTDDLEEFNRLFPLAEGESTNFQHGTP